MYRRRPYFLTSIVLTVSGLMVAGAAVAQQNRIREYESKLEKKIANQVEDFRSNQLEERRETLASMTTENPGVRPRVLSKPQPDAEMAEERRAELKKSIQSLEKPFKSVVNVSESKDGKGQDVEIRLTMPIDAFMEFAPVAALEAAAVLHKFAVVNIYLREETTDRVARVAFRDAEPIAGRYLAGDEAAVSDMNEIIIWH